MVMMAERPPHGIFAIHLNPNLLEQSRDKKPFPSDSPKQVNARWHNGFGFVLLVFVCLVGLVWDFFAGDTQPLGNGIAYLLYTCQIAAGQ